MKFWNIFFFGFALWSDDKKKYHFQKYGEPRKNMVKHFKFIWWRTLEAKLMNNIGAAERYLWVIKMSSVIASISASANKDKIEWRLIDRYGMVYCWHCHWIHWIDDVDSWGGRRMIYSDSKMNCCFFFPIVIDMVKSVNRVCLAAPFFILWIRRHCV